MSRSCQNLDKTVKPAIKKVAFRKENNQVNEISENEEENETDRLRMENEELRIQLARQIERNNSRVNAIESQ